MNATEIKKEFHDYIKIPDWHKEILEECAADYEKNPRNAISWDELRLKT